MQVGTTAQPGVTKTETAECRVIFKRGTWEEPHNNAEYDDVDVRTYRGRLQGSEVSLLGESSVWDKPLTYYNDRFQQSHVSSSWNDVSTVGCYMQRLSSAYASEFDLKDGVAYQASFGYRVFIEGEYNILSDRLTDSGWNADYPIYAAESASQYLYWWNIDSATGVLSSAVAAVALLTAF